MLRSLVYTFAAAAVLFAFTYSGRRGPEGPAKTNRPAKETRAVKTQPASNSLETQFAQQVYRSLQSGNTAAWLSLYPNDVFGEVAALRKEYSGNPALLGEKIRMLVAEKLTDAAESHSNEFRELTARASKAGLSWRSAEFSDFVFDRSNTSRGEDLLNGDIWLKANNEEFVIEGVEAVKTADGYRLQRVVDVKKIDPDE